ncbi:MAG: hypothetical protein C5B49_15255, partial [Bdellovibrio sp.]
MLSNGLGRDADALEDALLRFSPEQLSRVRQFSADMHEPFMGVIRKECPNAEISVDRF